MARILGDMDTWQLHFHARAAHHTNTFTAERGYRIYSPSSGRSIIVGLQLADKMIFPHLFD